MASSRAGFAGVVGLVKAVDWRRLASETIADVEKRRIQLIGAQSAEVALRMLDGISNRLCVTIDAAELCRCAHQSEEWRSEASAAFERCASYMDDLNVDGRLYEISVEASKSSLLSAEASILAESFKTEFERDGAHLGGAVRSSLNRTRGQIRALEAKLSEGDADPGPLDSPVLVARGSDDVARALKELGPYKGMLYKSPEALWATNAEACATVERRVGAAQARRAARAARQKVQEGRIDVVEQLASSRATLAQSLGAQSYAALTLAGPPASLARDEKTVAEFLTVASRECVPKARAEAARLALDDTEDIEYARHQLSPSIDGFSLDLHACVGVLVEVARFFGIEARQPEDVAYEELWANTVHRLDLFDGDRQLGVVYLDLQTRPGKIGGAACFTLRGGCALDSTDPPLTAFSAAENGSVWGVTSSAAATRQLATVALVCSFSSTGQLSHTDLETLLHEWGHVLHSLLSQTTSQHLSGTRGATDVVELASTLLEQYAWHLPLEKAPLEQLRRAKDATAALEMQHQLKLAIFDQVLHGNRHVLAPSTDGLGGFVEPAAQIAAALSGSNEGAHDFVKLTHLVNGPATYYVRLVLRPSIISL